MQIVNFIPETYQEFENHLSLVLFCYGCNLSCSWCYNREFVTNPNNILPKTAEQIIDENVNPLLDGLVFLGGEPLLYPDRLEELAKYVQSRHGLETKVYTNGFNWITTLRGLREGWLNAASIDFKCFDDCSCLGVDAYDYTKSLRILLDLVNHFNLNDKVEVRTTMHKNLTMDDLKNIERLCYYFNLKHIKQQEFNYGTLFS